MNLRRPWCWGEFWMEGVGCSLGWPCGARLPMCSLLGDLRIWSGSAQAERPRSAWSTRAEAKYNPTPNLEIPEAPFGAVWYRQTLLRRRAPHRGGILPFWHGARGPQRCSLLFDSFYYFTTIYIADYMKSTLSGTDSSSSPSIKKKTKQNRKLEKQKPELMID